MAFFAQDMPQADPASNGDFDLDGLSTMSADAASFFANGTSFFDGTSVSAEGSPQNAPPSLPDFGGLPPQTYLFPPAPDTNNSATSSVADMAASFYSRSETSNKGYMAPRMPEGHAASYMQERRYAPPAQAQAYMHAPTDRGPFHTPRAVQVTPRSSDSHDKGCCSWCTIM